MSDGLNDARGLRISELMNDFRTLQTALSAHLDSPQSNPPDPGSASLPGYAILQKCKDELQALQNAEVRTPADVSNESAGDGDTYKASLQQIILDAGARRFRAQKIYLRTVAALRWVQGYPANPPAYNQQLLQQMGQISDQHVFRELANADRRNGAWISEDPSLERIQAHIRSSS